MVDVVKAVRIRDCYSFYGRWRNQFLEDMKRILRAGADKVSLNTAAVNQPELITEGADFFGSQCIVVAIDAKYDEELGILACLYTRRQNNGR